MVETHIAHAINGRFQVLNGIPRQLTVGNLRQELMEVVIKFKKSSSCLCSMAMRCW